MPTEAWVLLDFCNASLLWGTTPIWRKCRKLYFQPSCYNAQPGLTFKRIYVLPTRCIYVLCMDLRTNSDYFPI
jgi:hypothetical protein